MGDKPRILLYDFELTPSLAYVWRHYETTALGYEKHWELLSMAWKWLGESKIRVISQRTGPERGIVHRAHELFEEADFKIAHHGDAFDSKKANSKFLEHGLRPPSPSVNIDTKKIAKKYFGFDCNKLDYLCERLKIGKKMETGGFSLWLGCMKGDYKSFLKMEEYNKHDVVILEKLYLKMRPWIDKQPGLSIATQRIECSVCGSMRLKKQGVRLMSGGYKQRYQCQACGGWSTGKLDPRDIP